MLILVLRPGRHWGFFSWKGDVSVAPGVDMTDALYARPDQAATQGGRPVSPRPVCISGNWRGLFIAHLDVKWPAFGNTFYARSLY